ncbi:MAG: hypothetical protein OEV53_01110 [Nitrospira sp.]|nr:hypothetical protein [Nitrospira sp.]
MISWITLLGLVLVTFTSGCAQSPYERGRHPTGYSRYDVERDYRDCEIKARLANDPFFYSQSSPFPFSPGPMSPADQARALHSMTTINAMRDTCLTSKGYRVE